MTLAIESGTAAAGRPECASCFSRAHTIFLLNGGYRIVRCDLCGLRYLHPQPSPAELAALYTKSYYSSENSSALGYASYESEAENWRRTFRDRLRLLPRPHGGRRLLDIGAATGIFVEQARLSGWSAEGIEPSEWAAAYARDHLRQPVHAGTLESARYPTATFDLVTLWEVIEHVPDPRALLEEIARILKPGGRLALSTPDAGSWVARIFGSRWLGWRKVPEHLYFFDQPSLERILTEAGFHVVERRYVSLTVTIGFALERLGSLIGARWLGRIPEFLRRRSVRVNPLYDLLVVARRQ